MKKSIDFAYYFDTICITDSIPRLQNDGCFLPVEWPEKEHNKKSIKRLEYSDE